VFVFAFEKSTKGRKSVDLARFTRTRLGTMQWVLLAAASRPAVAQRDAVVGYSVKIIQIVIGFVAGGCRPEIGAHLWAAC
jgi:hypothetical protein